MADKRYSRMASDHAEREIDDLEQPFVGGRKENWPEDLAKGDSEGPESLRLTSKSEEEGSEEEEDDMKEPLVKKATEKWPDGRPKEISRQKMFGRSYTTEIDEVKAGPKFKPASVDNKPVLVLFLFMVVGMLVLDLTGVATGAYGDFNAKFEIKFGGQTFHPSEIGLHSKWVAVLVAGLVFSALLPLVSLGLVSVFPYSVCWASCLLAPATLYYCGWLALQISDRSYIHTGLGPFWWRNWLVGICFIFGTLWLLHALTVYDKINFTATLIRCSTRLMGTKPSIICVGIGQGALSLFILLLWGLAMIVVADTYENKQVGMHVAFWIVFLPALWTFGVNHYCYFLTSAGLMARWYFGEVVSVGASLWMAWILCLGSVALGAAVLVAIKLVQSVLNCFVTSPKDGHPNTCYLACWRTMDVVEWLVGAFNRFSLVIIAIFGMSFEKSGYEAIRIIQDRGLISVVPYYILSFVAFGLCAAIEFFSIIGVLGISGWSVFGAVPHHVGGFARFVPPAYELGQPLRREAALDELRASQVAVLSLVFGVCVVSQFAAAIDGMSTSLLTCFAEDPNQFAKMDPEAYEWLSSKVVIRDLGDDGGDEVGTAPRRGSTQVGHFRKTDVASTKAGNAEDSDPLMRRQSIIGLV